MDLNADVSLSPARSVGATIQIQENALVFEVRREKGLPLFCMLTLFYYIDILSVLKPVLHQSQRAPI